jgi:hypothetical protein
MITHGKNIINTTKEDLCKIFDQQIKDEESFVTNEKINKLKSLDCYGKCPEIKVGDKLLFFFVGTITFKGNTIKKKINKGNIVSAYQTAEDHQVKYDLHRIKEDYLSDPNCELLNMKIERNQSKDVKIPRLFILDKK